MPLTISFDDLRSYTDLERAKWNAWFQEQPTAVFSVPFQSGGKFPTIWSMLDHIFVVEQRHLQRLRSEYPLPESTGIEMGDWPALASFAASTRQRFVDLCAKMSDEDAQATREFPIMGKVLSLTPRKLIFHVLIHEIRHWSQIATALRNAGYEPPGDHDLIFSNAML